jgi:hypothetical protein
MVHVLLIFSMLSNCLIVLAQSPGRHNWTQLAEKSARVIIGVVESDSLVVRRDKMLTTSAKTVKGEKIANLPNPNDYVVGHSIRVRIENLIKSDNRSGEKNFINIFVPGRLPTEGMPVLQINHKYLLLLSPLKEKADEFAAATIFQQDAPPGKERQFVADAHYLVVSGANGSEEVTSNNLEVIESAIKEIQAAKR